MPRLVAVVSGDSVKHAHYRVKGSIRIREPIPHHFHRKRRHRDGECWPSGHSSLPKCIDFGHILGAICGAEDAHYRLTGPILVCHVSSISDTYSGGEISGAENAH
ncbi:hypothetical protein DPMN_186659 [Dreissena polymorpha]|uniref:Uncharacterized protein n=1 Tax=Dreissena polymorpha TaxID=45954 RepID=A0A9D4I6Q5_DREPO|nr:hypothetical protein DPMN_186659 [Dreissena polymorpha]